MPTLVRLVVEGLLRSLFLLSGLRFIILIHCTFIENIKQYRNKLIRAQVKWFLSDKLKQKISNTGFQNIMSDLFMLSIEI